MLYSSDKTDEDGDALDDDVINLSEDNEAELQPATDDEPSDVEPNDDVVDVDRDDTVLYDVQSDDNDEPTEVEPDDDVVNVESDDTVLYDVQSDVESSSSDSVSHELHLFFGLKQNSTLRNYLLTINTMR